jgi:thioredoxin 1
MKRRLLLLCLASLAITVLRAHAAERHAFDAETFAAALETGKPILVHVTAPWCPQCRAQKPIVAALAERPAFDRLIIIDVDFDTQKEALRRLNVQKQSTLLVIKAKAEIARAVGITQPAAIEALMNKAL